MGECECFLQREIKKETNVGIEDLTCTDPSMEWRRGGEIESEDKPEKKKKKKKKTKEKEWGRQERDCPKSQPLCAISNHTPHLPLPCVFSIKKTLVLNEGQTFLSAMQCEIRLSVAVC